MTLDRIKEEIVKTEIKIEDLQNRLRELKKQKTAAENVLIVETVRNADIKLEEMAALTEFFRQRQNNEPPIGAESEKEERGIENKGN